jgi:hypothetical protein
VVEADGATDRSRKSAELGVKLADPGALVITKPAGAEICTEPSIWGDASFVTVNAKAVPAPAVGLDVDTATEKHLPEAVQVLEVAPAEGAASTAAASTPEAIRPKDTRAMIKPRFRTATPSICVNRET